jgi:hypothetical protein
MIQMDMNRLYMAKQMQEIRENLMNYTLTVPAMDRIASKLNTNFSSVVDTIANNMERLTTESAEYRVNERMMREGIETNSSSAIHEEFNQILDSVQQPDAVLVTKEKEKEKQKTKRIVEE